MRRNFNSSRTTRANAAALAFFASLGPASLIGCSTGTGSLQAQNVPAVAPEATAQTPAATTTAAGTTFSNTTIPSTNTTFSSQSSSPDFLPGTTLNVRRVTFAEEGADFDPCVSKDGSRLVFASTQHRATSDIYSQRTDSKVVTQLTSDPADDAMPALSPDGSRIAFASNRAGSWDIYVMPVRGGQAVQITSDSGDDVHPSWSPDGTELVFSRRSATSGRWEMWVAEAGNATVSHFIGFGLLPKWCPTPGTGENASDKILFQLGRERGRRSFGLWTIDYADGQASNPTEIASSTDKALINPTWSPDGGWIVFAEANASNASFNGANAFNTGNFSSTASGDSSLWMISVGGEGRVRLTQADGSHLSPTWGGGGRLYFVSGRNGHDNIWSLDLAPSIKAAMLMTNDPTRTSDQNPSNLSQPSTTSENSDEMPVANVGEESQAPIEPR